MSRDSADLSDSDLAAVLAQSSQPSRAARLLRRFSSIDVSRLSPDQIEALSLELARLGMELAVDDHDADSRLVISREAA